MKHRLLPATVLFGVLTLIAANADAQQFPTKPVRMVVPFPAGGSMSAISTGRCCT